MPRTGHLGVDKLNNVACPFYKGANAAERTITCEGFVRGTKCSLAFMRDPERKKWSAFMTKNCCSLNGWRGCPHAVLMGDLYEGGALE